MKNSAYLFVLFLMFSLSSCDSDSGSGSLVDEELNSEVLSHFSTNVAQASYNDLKEKAEDLYDDILALEESTNQDNLEACQDKWKEAREAWEQTESFLFGPVATEDIDPRIDTWPVDFTSLDSLLASDNEFSETEIDELEDALKGFHPIEYILFGEGGGRTAEELTERQIDYLKALGLNLKALTTEVADGWNPASSGNYHDVFTTAGNGSTEYETQQAAFEELVNAMAGICDEVANGKMDEVFLAQDPMLEESPFAKNSITDFKNNIIGVENVYMGVYSANGQGLEDLVKKYNLSLDGEIKTDIAAALAALNTVTDPFGEAISNQSTQVQNSIDAINKLKETLEDKLLPFVQQHVE